jgi:hypothetical protein
MKKLSDHGGHRMASWENSLRVVYFGNFEIVGPGHSTRMHTIEFYDLSPAEPTRPYAILRDTDLVILFDKQMDIYAWLDLAAERHPKIQKFADALGRLLSGAAK